MPFPRFLYMPLLLSFIPFLFVPLSTCVSSSVSFCSIGSKMGNLARQAVYHVIYTIVYHTRATAALLQRSLHSVEF